MLFTDNSKMQTLDVLIQQINSIYPPEKLLKDVRNLQINSEKKWRSNKPKSSKSNFQQQHNRTANINSESIPPPLRNIYPVRPINFPFSMYERPPYYPIFPVINNHPFIIRGMIPRTPLFSNQAVGPRLYSYCPDMRMYEYNPGDLQRQFSEPGYGTANSIDPHVSHKNEKSDESTVDSDVNERPT